MLVLRFGEPYQPSPDRSDVVAYVVTVTCESCGWTDLVTLWTHTVDGSAFGHSGGNFLLNAARRHSC